MAALRVLSSGRVRLVGGYAGSDFGLEKDPTCNVVRFGSDYQKTKLKVGRLKLKTVMAIDRGAETSSFSCVNGHGQGDRDFNDAGFLNGHGNCRKILKQMSSIEKSSNIVWHECSVSKHDRQNLLQQRGCVIWITGLSGSGKSTLACALSHSLHSRGKLTYVLDGDNLRHGLNRDLSFGADDRAENIRRVGEVAKLFVDAGVICIASLISPYRKDRDACRALLPKGDFIEVFMDAPLQLCEARDPKGLYKLARAGKIKGFTGIDDPYERPLNCEIVLQQKPDVCTTPCEMAETVVSYLEEHGYLQA